MADKIEGETILVPGDYLDYTVREPLGVTEHLVPWNVSLKLSARLLDRRGRSEQARHLLRTDST